MWQVLSLSGEFGDAAEREIGSAHSKGREFTFGCFVDLVYSDLVKGGRVSWRGAGGGISDPPYLCQSEQPYNMFRILMKTSSLQYIDNTPDSHHVDR